MNYSCFLGDKSEAPRLDEKQHGGTSKSNALLQFETLANWNLQTPNRKLQFAVCTFPRKSLMLKRSLKSFVLLQTRLVLLAKRQLTWVPRHQPGGLLYTQLDNITSLYWFFLETRNLKGLQNVIRSSWKKREKEKGMERKKQFSFHDTWILPPFSSRIQVWSLST